MKSICIQNDDNGTSEPEKEDKTISEGDTKLENEAGSSRSCSELVLHFSLINFFLFLVFLTLEKYFYFPLNPVEFSY